MKLKNSFDIPLPPDAAWSTLLDIERIALCLPGATLTEKIDDRTYRGKVAVRLGPVALSFNGKAAFVEIDEAGHRARVRAQGMDEKGRGGAQADVTFQLEAAGGNTHVVIDTELTLSGSVAQYGRSAGIIQATSEQLVGEFADNLRRQLSHKGTKEAESGKRPISGLALTLRVVWRMITGALRRTRS